MFPTSDRNKVRNKLSCTAVLWRVGAGEGPASPWEHLADIQAGALTRELISRQNNVPGSISGCVKKCCILATLSIALASAGLEALKGGGGGW